MLGLLALALPWLLTATWPPASTFLNQAAAWAAWAAFVWMVLARSGSVSPVATRAVMGDVSPVLLILGVMTLACAIAPLWTGLPASLVASNLASLLGATVVMTTGAVLVRERRLSQAVAALFVPLVIAGLLSAVVVVVQVFFDDFAGNAWIASSALPQRGSGNIRQPNHLSSLSVWALVGLVWLRERGWLRLGFVVPLGVLLIGSVVLSGSRTGMVGIVLLAAWAGLDRGMSRGSRWLLGTAPLTYALAWWLFRGWATVTAGDVETVDRITAVGSGLSNARFAIWSNTLELIARHPWAGVGFGEFNFAWSLTPFPGRPTQFYDHTHNLLLQWAVEMGLPLALLMTAATVLALWRALRAARLATGDERSGVRAAFVALLLILLHSMLEYPLWYAYFLLPTAFAFGICLASDPVRARSSAAAPSRTLPAVLGVASALVLVLTVVSVFDYRRVVVIFAPPALAAPLAERMADGRHSIFFAHHAAYAAATTAEDPASPAAVAAFDDASHFLLDTRFMMAWARSYDARGETEKARFLADRLREFGNEASAAFFGVCDKPPAASTTPPDPPFQCRPTDAALDYRAFR